LALPGSHMDIHFHHGLSHGGNINGKTTGTCK
jgi:hypothetical protein